MPKYRALRAFQYAALVPASPQADAARGPRPPPVLFSGPASLDVSHHQGHKLAPRCPASSDPTDDGGAGNGSAGHSQVVPPGHGQPDAGSGAAGSELGAKFEAEAVDEDPIVGHERQAEGDSGDRDPQGGGVIGSVDGCPIRRRSALSSPKRAEHLPDFATSQQRRAEHPGIDDDRAHPAMACQNRSASSSMRFSMARSLQRFSVIGVTGWS